jgi:two-component system, NarL family, nitrate/nitrite response regulator NarL
MERDHNHTCTIRVLVADNSPFHTELLVGALKRDPDLQVVSSDLNAASLVAASSSQRIDVFVLSAFSNGDAELGFKVLQQLRETSPHARAVMLLDSSKPESILAAFRAGAKGVFHHQESSDVLCRCIHRVHEGQAWVSHEQMTLVLEALASTPKIRAVDGKGMDLLSTREVEVVTCLAEGLTNREIAQRMGLSQHTIKNYLFRIFDKLGVSNRIELLFMTLSQGTGSPVLFKGLPMDPADGYDEGTFTSCQKAAEEGMVTAQVALARMLSMGRMRDRDLIQAFVWFCIAIDQITRSKNSVKKAMNPEQLAEAERRVREALDKSRGIEAAPPTHTSLGYERTH